MCGIVAVLRRPSHRQPPALEPLVGALDAVRADLEPLLSGPVEAVALDAVAAAAERVDVALRGVPGVRALLGDPVAAAGVERRATELHEALSAIEERLDRDAASAAPLEGVEAVNAALVRARDAVWAIARDRLRTARAVEDLARSSDAGSAAIDGYTSIQLALSALDRLEVRGRDSAGLQVVVTGHGLDLAAPEIAGLLAPRSGDLLFESGSVRTPEGHLAFVYKTAAEIGELGDNTAALRGQIREDELLRLALGARGAEAFVLGHTRWASVGIISEANAHPLHDEEVGRPDGPYVAAVLNGDVDNYADLIALEGLRVPTEVTTDAKVIPALVARRIAAGAPLDEAFRATVASFEGSVAIAAQSAIAPHRLLLAQRGSGQALYVGFAEDAFVVASEPYGLVEEADRYLRLDGESPADPENPASAGQLVVLDGTAAGELTGVARRSYTGVEQTVTDSDLAHLEITTRDVDRGDSPHYLLKEISESPASFRKTLRGKIVEEDGRLRVLLPEGTLPEELRGRLRAAAIRQVLVIGQGTAAVAGQSLAAALERALGSRPVAVEALIATELSGFGLADDMSDALVVAISQSGTTTDTNRTVDLVRSRGASVISIVNRRQSDLVDKSDGVLYTSDGRDVEMSVASTKAFYAQVAAGFLLAHAIAAELGPESDAELDARDEVLRALRDLPVAMTEVLARRSAIAGAAQRQAPSRRSWAVVGNGVNRIAAHEVRIKLSELCYKSIACDVTEDKKHIDLSAEPMILVCAAGLRGSNADDVGKELEIYRAHKAAAVAVVDDGEIRLRAALETLAVPPVHPEVAFVLSAMAGHLFGYEAALAIDASARPLREARGVIEELVSGQRPTEDLLAELARTLRPVLGPFFAALRSGTYDGQLDAATAVRLSTVLRYATGLASLDAYQLELGKVGTPSTLIEDLTAALTAAIEELTRPIDAIKHQAKTVTVGISRSDETLLRVRLVQEVLAAGIARDNLSYRVLRTLAELDAAVGAVTGFTRYRIDGEPEATATIHVVDRGGVATGLRSRTDDDPRLRGTKHRVATEREVTVVRGRSDGRTIVIVPEVKGTQTVGIALLHVRFHERLPANVAKRVLQGYRDRYQALVDQVTETEPAFADVVLGEIDLVDLLTEPVARLADRWR